jgi:hypothetical protein
MGRALAEHEKNAGERGICENEYLGRINMSLPGAGFHVPGSMWSGPGRSDLEIPRPKRPRHHRGAGPGAGPRGPPEPGKAIPGRHQVGLEALEGIERLKPGTIGIDPKKALVKIGLAIHGRGQAVAKLR